MMKIGLGTVQFGTDYGISNKNGCTPLSEVAKILQLAKKAQIDIIDTASAYGNSEEVLGYNNLDDFKVITKIPGFKNNSAKYDTKNFIHVSINNSLNRLKVNNLYGVLFHSQEDLITKHADTLWETLYQYKKEGLIKKIGVSVYDTEILEEIIKNFKIDIVQFPLNILDHRFLPLLPKLKTLGIETHARSIFLQGLLLMNPNEINPFFDELKPLLNKIPDERIKFLLNFAKNPDCLDKMIIGVTSSAELEQIIYAYNENYEADYKVFSIDNPKYIKPQNWRLK